MGGFDVAVGVAVFALASASVSPHFGDGAAHLTGALAFGVAFVLNLVGGAVLAVVLTRHTACCGADRAIVRLAEHVAGYSFETAFLGGLVAGGRLIESRHAYRLDAECR